MKCAYHEDRDAVGICVSCGAGLCTDCREVVRGSAYCEECLKTHRPMRIHPDRVGSGLNSWAVVSWLLAAVSWWPGMAMLAILSVLIGMVAYVDIRAGGNQQGGLGYARAGIIFGIASLVVKFGLYAIFVKSGINISPWIEPFKYVDVLK